MLLVSTGLIGIDIRLLFRMTMRRASYNYYMPGSRAEGLHIFVSVVLTNSLRHLTSSHVFSTPLINMLNV
jgi:hypothetical protein